MNDAIYLKLAGIEASANRYIHPMPFEYKINFELLGGENISSQEKLDALGGEDAVETLIDAIRAKQEIAITSIPQTTSSEVIDNRLVAYENWFNTSSSIGQPELKMVGKARSLISVSILYT